MIRITPAFGSLTFSAPTRAVQPRWPAAPFYVLQQDGLIHRVVGTGPSASSSVFADLRKRVAYPLDPSEGGLLGIAFSPDFAKTQDVFLSYTTYAQDKPFRRVITRMKSWDHGLTLDPTTESFVIDMVREVGGHNGGEIAFGPDGYLYASLGDGHFGDPDGNAQNPNVLFGKLLRIDVSVKPYAIPPDNPFVSGGGRPEVWALGFRNPWSFSFDSATGDLWLGDVGHHSWEEINLVTKGGNYGWNLREGTHCFLKTPCVNPALIDPVYEYGHLEGTAANGGVMYRGKAIPELVGHFVFGDWGLGTLSMLEEDPATKKMTARKLLTVPHLIASMSQDADGELYFTDYRGGIYKIERNDVIPASPESLAPAHLSDTGCVQPADKTKLDPSLIPYEVNLGFWSDGAAKERAFAIPPGTQIAVQPDGSWSWPAGAVTMKTFSLGGRRIETRLMVNHFDVGWSGYSYEWNDDETEATLLEERKTKTIGGVEWTYPSRGECLFCHASGQVLGLRPAQLNRMVAERDGTLQNQLERFQALGLFDRPIDVASAARLVAPSDASATLDQRARSWLDVNCSYCHRPYGSGQGPADFRIENRDPHVCNFDPTVGDLGLTGAKLVVPGAPSLSLLYVRATTRGPNQMPPLGSTIVDPEGEALLRQWIGSGTACP